MGKNGKDRAVFYGAVLYCRVSKEQAERGVSLESQEERLRAYCTMRGLEVVSVVVEDGVSGGKPLGTRPGGMELAQLVAKRKVAHVVALKLDRLFRDAEDALRQTRAWDKAGVALHLVDLGGQAVDTASAMGRMFLTMTAAFAELERNLISERTSAALQHKKHHGQVYGPTPYGFDRQGVTLIESAEEQAVLASIGERREAGHSFGAIARDLEAREVPTKQGGTWKAATVRYMLQSDRQLCCEAV